MFAAAAILRASRRLLEIAAQQCQVVGVENRPVVQQMRSLPLLRVAGKLPPRQRQIADALQPRPRHRQRLDDAMQNVRVTAAQIVQRGIAAEGEDDAETQAAGAQHHRPAAGRAPQHRHAVGGAGAVVDIVGDLAAGADDDGRPRPFPQTKHFATATVLGFEQQRLVKGKVFGRGGQRQVEVVHLSLQGRAFARG